MMIKAAAPMGRRLFSAAFFFLLLRSVTRCNDF
jgi:hypothetical protein